MGQGQGRRRLWISGSMNMAYFSFPSPSNSVFTERRCLGLEIFTWLVSHQRNNFFFVSNLVYTD